MFAVAMSGNVLAQSTQADSLKALQDKRTVDSYLFTGNAATVAENLPRYGYARATASSVAGDFKRPMEPSATAAYGLSTGGSMKIGNWNLLADFAYQKRYDRRVGWAAVNDPYGGNPFIWADSSRGKWDRDEVKATIGASARLTGRWKAGLAVDYHIGTGARTSEPKPFYRSRDISLQPGVVYRLSSSQEIGLSGTAAFTQEENEIGYYSNSNVLLYRLRGYGTFSKSPFVSGERKRQGTRWKGGGHYLERWPTYQLLVQAAVSQIDEEVFEGVARTQTTGYFTGINLGGKVRLSTGNARKGKSLELSFENKNGYADDMIFRAESASCILHDLQAEWSAWKQRGDRDLLQWTVMPSLRYVDYVDQASYMQFTATTVGGSFQFNYRKGLGDQFNLGVKPAAGYYHTIDDGFTSRAQHVVIREIIRPDYQYFRNHFWRINCELELGINSKHLSSSHWITLSGDMRWSNNKEQANRITYQLQYSMLF